MIQIVNSTKLDAAMTLTANAIRDKTCESEAIAWDVNTGFSAAIAAIPVARPFVTITVTLSAEASSGTVTWLSDSDFVRNNHTADGFFAMVWAVTPTSDIGYVNFTYGSRHAVCVDGSKSIYGITATATSETASNLRQQTGQLGVASSWNGGLNVYDGHAIVSSPGSSTKFKAGKYAVLVGVLDLHAD